MPISQRQFNKAVRGVIKQGRPSMENGRCLYLAPDGRRCIVGHLLPKKELKPELESAVPGMWPTNDARPNFVAMTKLLQKLNYTVEDCRIMQAMQSAHDFHVESANFIEDFKRAMRYIAEKHGFKWIFDSEEACQK